MQRQTLIGLRKYSPPKDGRRGKRGFGSRVQQKINNVNREMEKERKGKGKEKKNGHELHSTHGQIREHKPNKRAASIHSRTTCIPLMQRCLISEWPRNGSLKVGHPSYFPSSYLPLPIIRQLQIHSRTYFSSLLSGFLPSMANPRELTLN